jgi:hypothetical protein
MAMILLFGPFAHGEADAKTPRRLAWVGLVPGPLQTEQADALEALILDELDGYDSFRLVDAGGHALDDRLLAFEASRVAKLIDEGVSNLLALKHKKAIVRLDQAIEVFETRLTSLRDHELLHFPAVRAINMPGRIERRKAYPEQVRTSTLA